MIELNNMTEKKINIFRQEEFHRGVQKGRRVLEVGGKDLLEDLKKWEVNEKERKARKVDSKF